MTIQVKITNTNPDHGTVIIAQGDTIIHALQPADEVTINVTSTDTITITELEIAVDPVLDQGSKVAEEVKGTEAGEDKRGSGILGMFRKQD